MKMVRFATASWSRTANSGLVESVADNREGIAAGTEAIAATEVDDLTAADPAAQASAAELGDAVARLDSSAADSLTIARLNLRLESGAGSTDDGGSLTGLGNLIIGDGEIVSGCHNLIVGFRYTVTCCVTVVSWH